MTTKPTKVELSDEDQRKLKAESMNLDTIEKDLYIRYNMD